MADRLPCGCVMDAVGDAMVFQPCSRDCPALAHLLDRVQESGTELRVIQDPELGAVPLIYRCPGCGQVQDAQDGIGDAAGKTPDPGDLGVCSGCGHVFVFTGGGPVSLDAVELVAVLAADAGLAKVVAVIRGKGGA